MADATVDSEIFARLKAGDMAACRMCVEEHSDELYRLAYRMVRDEQAAQDIVQKTFLHARTIPARDRATLFAEIQNAFNAGTK